MPIYEATGQQLTAVPTASFAALGIKERGDLQRLLAARIDALEDGLLVLAEEFADWSDSARRIDLLCLDREASLVVVELKRDDDGGHMELQALRYAAMVSAMTFDQATAARASFRKEEAATARAAILGHLGWTVPQEEDFAKETRIVLAAADFGKEITTTVLWLRDRYDLDIRCVRLRPYRLPDGRLLLDIQTLIPLPEAEAFQVRVGAKKAAEQKEKSEREALLARFLEQLALRAAPRTSLHAGRTPDAALGILYGAIGRTGFSINYHVAKDRSRVELLIQRQNARDQLLKLKEAQVTIEHTFGGPLEWMEKEGVQQCRALHPIEGGYRTPEADWSNLHDEMIDAMIRLDKAFRLQVGKLS